MSALNQRVRGLLRRQFVRDTLILQVAKGLTAGLSALSSLVVWRLMGPQQFGVFALVETFLTLWFQLDLTGASTAMYTRLGIARGAQDSSRMIDVMAVYWRISLLVNTAIALLAILFGGPVAAITQNNARIGVLAGVLAIALLMDSQYGLVLTAFGSARQMRWLALLSFLNQAVLTISLIGAAALSATPESLIIGRLVYSSLTLMIALILYQRIHAGAGLPSLRTVIRRAGQRIERGGYASFGLANGLDKNISVLFVQLPQLIVGRFGGEAAVGFLNLALSAIINASILTAAIFENVQAIVPQAVGRGDFRGLRRDILRIIAVLGIGALVVYGAVALLSPLIIPPILGERWIPAIDPLIVLTIYGAITAVGGVFGPLYRAFGRMRSALTAKIITLLVVLPPAVLIFHAGSSAVGGAWMIALLFAVSVLLTAAFTLPELIRRGSSHESRSVESH